MSNHSSELKRALARVGIPELWSALRLPGDYNGGVSPFVKHRGAGLRVWRDSRSLRWRFRVDGSGETGDAIDFLQMATGCSVGDAIREFIRYCDTGVVPGHWLPREPEPEMPPQLLNVTLLTPTDEELRDIALSEGFVTPSGDALVDGLQLMRQEGMIFTQLVQHGSSVRRFASVTGRHRAHIVGNEVNPQPGHDRVTNRAHPRSCGSWPIYAGLLGQGDSLLLVSDLSDYFAAYQFVADLEPSLSRTGNGRVVPIYQACDEMHPRALAALEGHHVLIVPSLADLECDSLISRQLHEQFMESCVSSLIVDLGKCSLAERYCRRDGVSLGDGVQGGEWAPRVGVSEVCEEVAHV